MSAELQAALQRDRQAMRRATREYVRGLDPSEILRDFEAAGTHAIYADDTYAAYQLRHVINVGDAYGDHLRANASILLAESPEYLQHFPPNFVKGVIARTLAPA